jgi:FkbM family methyltransferase
VKQQLQYYLNNVYSQNGEDGLLAEMCRRLQIDQGWCVEFGAWDGKHFSNCFNLITQGWKGVFIEGDTQRYQDLLKTVEQYPNITPINAWVNRLKDDEHSLDNLLALTSCPEKIDILSIDIDSHDLDVWESLCHYNPKIVIIEINSAAAADKVWRHQGVATPPKDRVATTVGYLNTYAATQEVATKKGYTLVMVIGKRAGNCVYIRNDVLPKLGLDTYTIQHPTACLYSRHWMKNSELPNLFLDCGSNLGQGFFEHKKVYGTDNFVYHLFEPNPTCYEQLTTNVGLLDYVKLHNVAVGTTDSELRFYYNTDFDQGGTLVHDHNTAYYNNDDSKHISVRCIDLDAYIDNLSHYFNRIIIKLDVESAEYDILDRFIETGRIHRFEKIIIEFHSQYMNEQKQQEYRAREQQVIQLMTDNDIDLKIWV